VAFKPGCNVNSDCYGDEAINLLGEIRKMQPLSLTNVDDLLGEIRKMQPLSLTNVDDLDQTTYISGNGTVSSVESDPPSFLINATQYVAGGSSSDDIAIRGFLNSRKWINPQDRVPQPKAVIAFWGILQHFESYLRVNKTTSTCVVVAVDDITYLYNPPREKQLPSSTTDSPEPKKTLREQLKARAEQHSSQSTSSPSTSQTKLGKRKAQSSEDEVDEDV